MKTKGTILLLTISGVVFMAYFLFSDFLSSDESSDGSSVELATGSTAPPLNSEGEVGQPKHKSFRRMDSSDEAIPESNLAPHGTEESEKWDQEQAEAREQTPKQTEQDLQNIEAQEEDGDRKTLNEEQRASSSSFSVNLPGKTGDRPEPNCFPLTKTDSCREAASWRTNSGAKSVRSEAKSLSWSFCKTPTLHSPRCWKDGEKRTRRKFLITSPSLIYEARKSKNTWKRPIPVNTPLWINSRTA